MIVLQAGETSAVGRLPYLQKGILHDLIVATHGIGVVIEHRYYGKSLPTSNFSTESLRFLTTDQALADQVYFAKHVKFAGLEDQKLNAPDVPYLAYGGSYAGGFSAFIRKLYPDVFWGMFFFSSVVARTDSATQEQYHQVVSLKPSTSTGFILNQFESMVHRNAFPTRKRLPTRSTTYCLKTMPN